MQTIDLDLKPEGSFYSIAELNALFAELAVLINGKLDVRGDVVEGDIILAPGHILNLPEPTAAGDLERYSGS